MADATGPAARFRRRSRRGLRGAHRRPGADLLAGRLRRARPRRGHHTRVLGRVMPARWTGSEFRRRYTGALDGCGITQGRVRPLRRLGTRRRRRPAHVLRAVRPAASRPGIRRHRGLRRHNILVYKDLGLVSQVFNEATLTTLHGDLAVGHTRYSTTGSTTWENAQPVFKTDGIHSVALGHNGNLVNTAELAATVGRPGRRHDRLRPGHHDDRGRDARVGGLEDAAMRVLPTLRGAFCVRVHGRAERLRGARPPRRSPAVDRTAPERVRASPRRPARSTSWAPRSCATWSRASWSGSTTAGCTASGSPSRPSGRSASSSSSTSRGPTPGCGTSRSTRRAGRWAVVLAREHPADADLVIAVPTTGHSAAQGYSRGHRHPVRRRALQEHLRRAHVHPAVAVAPRPRREAEAQPAARLDPRQAARRGRRLDRPRDHHEAGRSRCCARRVRPRCTSGSRARRCSGRASTGSTCRRGRS